MFDVRFGEPSPPEVFIAMGLVATAFGVVAHKQAYLIGGIYVALLGCYRLWYPRRRPR